MTTDELKAIRERCDKATAGPWWREWIEMGFRYWRKQFDYSTFDLERPEPEENVPWSREDADFFIHARTDIPALLDALEAANQRIAELEREVP